MQATLRILDPNYKQGVLPTEADTHTWAQQLPHHALVELSDEMYRIDYPAYASMNEAEQVAYGVIDNYLSEAIDQAK